MRKNVFDNAIVTTTPTLSPIVRYKHFQLHFLLGEYVISARSPFHKLQLYHWHCVKSVLIRSFSGPYFRALRLKYSVFLRIWSKCAKAWTRETPSTDTFCAVWRIFLVLNKYFCLVTYQLLLCPVNNDFCKKLFPMHLFSLFVLQKEILADFVTAGVLTELLRLKKSIVKPESCSITNNGLYCKHLPITFLKFAKKFTKEVTFFSKNQEIWAANRIK